MSDLVVAELSEDDVPAAAALLGLAYRDNPLNVALLGDDPEIRTRAGERKQAIRLASMNGAVVARDGREIVGVYGLEPPGGMVMPPERQRQMANAFSEAGPGVMTKAGQMLSGFAANAPAGHSWKLGPVAVAPHRQGSGIGSQMVEHFCARIDALGTAASLDTDRIENVRLYERYGFELVAEAAVIGVSMWFMARPPRKEL